LPPHPATARRLEAGSGPEFWSSNPMPTRLMRVRPGDNDYWQQQVPSELSGPIGWKGSSSAQGPWAMNQLRQRSANWEDNAGPGRSALPPGFVAVQPLGDQLTAYWSELWPRVLRTVGKQTGRSSF